MSKSNVYTTFSEVYTKLKFKQISDIFQDERFFGVRPLKGLTSLNSFFIILLDCWQLCNMHKYSVTYELSEVEKVSDYLIELKQIRGKGKSC